MAVVTRISIAPVKGLALVHPDEVELARTGVAANRRFHIVDENGRRYNQLRNAALVQIRPDYDPDTENLTLTFPNGRTVAGIVQPGAPLATHFFGGRPVPGRVVDGPWEDELSRWAGCRLRLVQSPPGTAVDRGRGHVSMISRASLDALARSAGAETVDGRRFRMLFEIDGVEPHEEDKWISGRVRIGDAVVKIRGDVARCAITTQNPETGEVDLDTLRVIAGYRPVRTSAAGKKQIPFGVFGEVVSPGRVHVGDVASPLQPSLAEAPA